MSKKYTTNSKLYEIGFTFLLVVNVILLLYFILKINQLEDISQETQAQAQELIIKLNEQSK